MSHGDHVFVLAGNGSWSNRGCEGIELGTIEIIRAAFPGAQFVIAPFGEWSEPDRHAADSGSTRVAFPSWVHSRRSPRWLWRAFMGIALPRHRFRTFVPHLEAGIGPHLDDAAAVLSIGGDNYSLDWGPPDLFWALDEVAHRGERPIVLWGCSVGPFSRRSRYEEFAIERLGRETCIMAREDLTVEYLADHGVTENVMRVADPAFAFPAKDPGPERLGLDVGELTGAVGLNLAPLLGRYLGMQRKERVAQAADVIRVVRERTGRPIVLVPHVLHPPHNDDQSFMEEAALLVPGDGPPVNILPRDLSGAEAKWAIGRLDVLIASRMHAAIAGISTGVPTGIIAYSMKGHGVSRDVFGHERFVLDVSDYGAERVAGLAETLLAEAQDVRAALAEHVPKITAHAMEAGVQLARLLGRGGA